MNISIIESATEEVWNVRPKIRQCLIRYMIKLEKLMYNNFNHAEIISMTINEKDLFECSAKVKNNKIQKDFWNCSDILKFEQHYLANNDFGICYSIKPIDNDVLLGENDFIQIKINYDEQKKFMVNKNYHWHLQQINFDNKTNKVKENLIKTLDANLREKLSSQNFKWFIILIDNNGEQMFYREIMETIEKLGFESTIDVNRIQIDMLSLPYMEYCQRDCEYII